MSDRHPRIHHAVEETYNPQYMYNYNDISDWFSMYAQEVNIWLRTIYNFYMNKVAPEISHFFPYDIMDISHLNSFPKT